MRNPVKVILGMGAPACHLVAQELIRRGGYNPDAPATVVVPTREAARLLKEQIAVHSAQATGSGAFPSPHIMPAAQLTGSASEAVAPACVSVSMWRHSLRKHPAAAARIFPKTDDWNEEAWLNAAEGLQRTFHTLAQEGVETGGSAWQQLAEEDSRWEALQELRHHYLDALHTRGLEDADEHPALQVPEGSSIILACVPGLTKQAEHLLAASPNPVEVWLPCDEPYADWFDAWGRPDLRWLDTTDRDELGLSRPGWQDRLIVTGDAWALAAATARSTAQANAAEGGGLHAVALGVCDPALEPAIAEEFALHGAPTYRPQGIPFSATSWSRVLETLQELAARPGVTSNPETFPVAPLGELLRQPVIQHGLDIEAPAAVMEQFKKVRAEFLPDSVGFLLQKSIDKPELRSAVTLLQAWTGRLLATPQALLQGLHELAGAQPVEGPGDEALYATNATIARSVGDICAKLMAMRDTGSVPDLLILLQKELAGLRVPEAREGNALAFNGWMELLYSPAKRLVIAGMHDKLIPERWPLSPLLTRPVREVLGIRGDEYRAARDAFILRSLLGSRHPGAVTFVFSLTDIRKDPAAPSPLLFTLCPKNRLPELVMHFFGPDAANPGTASAPFSVEGWRYTPLAQLDYEPTPEQAANLTLADLGLENPLKGCAFSPSMLADFLACPLRFWIKRILQVKTDDMDADRETLEHNSVGDCLHKVLELFVRRYPSWRHFAEKNGYDIADDGIVHAVEESLLHLFHSEYKEKYGDRPTLPQQFQRENMAARLRAYAPLHVEMWREDWETVVDGNGNAMVEYKPDWTWSGHRMNIKIDRVDTRRCIIDGQEIVEIRIIDYKTGHIDTASKKHLKKRDTKELPISTISPDLVETYAFHGNSKRANMRWVDLQLPIYVHWAMHQFPKAFSFGAAYIALDSTPDKTRLVPWGAQGLADPVELPFIERMVWAPDNPAFERGLMQVGPVIEGKRKKDGDFLPPRLIETAANWAQVCMDLISQGRCLISSEQMGRGKPPYDVFADATENIDINRLFLTLKH